MLPSFLTGEFYTSRAGFIFIWGVSLTHPILASFLHILFYFDAGNFSYTSHAVFIFVKGIWHIPRCFHFYAGSFSYRNYTSQAPFIFMWGVSLTHPVLAFFLFFSFLVWGASFLCSLLSNNPLRKEVGGSWPRGKVWKYHTQTREGSPRTTRTEQNITKQELGEKWAQ